MSNLTVEKRLPADEDMATAAEAMRFLAVSRPAFWRGVQSGYIPQPHYVLPRSPRWTYGELRRHRHQTRRSPVEARELRRRARLARRGQPQPTEHNSDSPVD